MLYLVSKTQKTLLYYLLKKKKVASIKLYWSELKSKVIKMYELVQAPLKYFTAEKLIQLKTIKEKIKSGLYMSIHNINGFIKANI